MKAIRYNVTIPRYAFGKVAGKLYPPLLLSGLSCLYSQDVPEPALPGGDWVKIKTRYGGICGTDISTVHLRTSTYYEPFTSSPFTLGHENVGVIIEVGPGVEGWQVGDRVIADPTLWCAPRGFAEEEWCEYCQKGEVNRCQRVAEGAISPGKAIGACKDTGGSWSAVFTAHQSLLYRIPGEVSDENALLVEPFACGLHAALQNFPADDETVLIFGAGTIGLMLLASLRALGSKARILVSARYPFQAEAAEKLGADEVLLGRDIYQQVAERAGGKLFKPIIGKRVLVGGVDRVYECVGKDKVLDDAIRLTKTGGNVVVVGVPGMAKGIDWAAIFDNELTITASYIYNHADHWKGKMLSTYDIALELMSTGQVDLGWVVNRRYPLGQYKQALRDIGDKKNHDIIKAVFEFED